MAKRRIPEVDAVSKRKPDVSVSSGVMRSKPTADVGTKDREIPRHGNRKNIVGLSAPTRERSIGSIEAPVGRSQAIGNVMSGSSGERAKPINDVHGGVGSASQPTSRFFSINAPTPRSRPSVEPVNGSGVSRSKPATSLIGGTQSPLVSGIAPVSGTPPRSSVGGGPIQRGASRPRPLRVSDL